MNLVLIIYIANMIYSYICLREIELSFNQLHSQHDLHYICLRENELSFNHLHSQHDLQLHMFERD